jgi:hypothetical protein
MALDNWPPLLNCYDVTDGKDSVDGSVTMADVFVVAGKFGAAYPSDDYLLLYDVDGGGSITTSDIFAVAGQFGQECPLIETQVALATLAAIKYRDPQQAFDDGYTWASQDVPQMGIHLVNDAYQVAYPDFESQLEYPVGLVYSETSPGSNQPDEFIGVWYNVPNQAVCDFYSISDPCESDEVQPVGFGVTNTDEDNQDPSGPQQGWHLHEGLCIAGWGTVDAKDWELGPGTEAICYDPPYNGGIWFSTYGWMAHLYNFIPNPDGRFMLWNTNPDFP